MSNPNNTRIIVRNPGAILPEDYLRKAIKDTNCGGYAVQTVENGTPTLISDHNDTAPDVESVQSLLNGYANNRILLTFSKLDKIEENAYPPYDFSMPGDVTPLMCFAIAGEFLTPIEGFATQETNFANKVILPNFNKFLKLSDGDLEKFIAEVKDDTFVDSLLARIGERGIFAFLPPVGDHIWHGKNKLGSTYPWGQVSDTLGYVEVPATTAQSQATKSGWWSKKSGPALPTAEDKPATTPAAPDKPLGLPEPRPDTKIDVPPVTPSPPGTQPAGTEVDLPGGLKGVWKGLPPGLSNKDKKAVVRRVTNCGSVLPENYDKPGWTYLEIQYPSKARDLPELKEKLEQQAQKPVAEAPTRGSEVVHEANIMVLTAEEASAAEAGLIKIMDRQGKEVPNPIDIQKMESKYPSFTGKFGIKLDQVNTWLPADIAAFAKDNGKAFFHLFLETNRAKINAEAALTAIGDKHTKSSTDSPKEELRPEPKVVAAGGGWGWGKK